MKIYQIFCNTYINIPISIYYIYILIFIINFIWKGDYEN
jgi:hypothetical protein